MKNIIQLNLTFDDTILSCFKYLGAGCAAISILGSAIGIGIIFSSLISSFSSNPKEEETLFNYAIIGFALCEAIALFGLMIVFLILFS